MPRAARRSRIPGCKTAAGPRRDADVLRQQRDLEQQLRLGLAARELHRRDRLVRDAKSQAAPRGLAVDVEIRRAIAGGGAERVLGGTALHQQYSLRVVAHFGGEAQSPERDRARHRLLHVGVARQLDGPSRTAKSSSASATATAPALSACAASARYKRKAAST